MSNFVKPETDVLTISGGDTLVVKRQLNNGEQRAQFARMYIAGVTPMTVNPLQTGMAIVTSYLLDWSLRDDEGRPVPIAGLSIEQLEPVLDSLDPERFAEIKEAIEAHEKTQKAKKKAIRSGEPASSATSSSPPDSAGATSGSAS